VAREDPAQDKDPILTTTSDQSPKLRVVLPLGTVAFVILLLGVLGRIDRFRRLEASQTGTASGHLAHPALWFGLLAVLCWVFCYFEARQLQYARATQKARFTVNLLIGLMFTALAVYFLVGYGD